MILQGKPKTDKRTGVIHWGDKSGNYIIIPHLDGSGYTPFWVKDLHEVTARSYGVMEDEELAKGLTLQDALHKAMNHWEYGREYTRHISKGRLKGKWELLNSLSPYMIQPFVDKYLLEQNLKTLTIVMTQASAEIAGLLMERLPVETQQEVLVELAKDLWVAPEVIEQCTADMLQVLAQIGINPDGSRYYRDRMDEVYLMLKNMSKDAATKLREHLAQVDPLAFDKLDQLHMDFNDILLMDDKSMQVLLREINNDELLAGLKGTDDKLKEKFFQNMSERAAKMLREDLDKMGPVKVADVEQAQEIILKAAKRLESEGSIVIMGKGSDDVIL